MLQSLVRGHGYFDNPRSCRCGSISVSLNFTEQSAFRVQFTSPCLVYNPSRNVKCYFREPIRLRKCISRGHLFVCGNASPEATRSGLHDVTNREQRPHLYDETRPTTEFSSSWASVAGARGPLSRDEEISFSSHVQNMLHLERRKEELEKELGRTPTVEEWAEHVGMSVFKLYARIGMGRAAKRKMVAANIRLVNSVAEQFHGRGLSHWELCQEGASSLLKSTEKYDTSYNTKFSTYSFMGIWKKMSEGVKKFQNVLRISRTVYETASIILKHKEEFIVLHGRQPSLQELSESTLLEKDRIRDVLRIVSPVNSMEKTISTLEDDHEIEIEDQDQDCLPWTRIMETELKSQVTKALKSLAPREEKVLQMRYGLGGDPPKQRSEVGVALNLSYESIRLIEKKALDKLRQIAREDGLQHYLSGSSWTQ